ncbi:MAG: phosphoribosylanthranilate isomerase [Methylococcaceae bacterium]|nr:phosphoribosylanthranilate isomerase [Methylococcaceae bacterium]
MNNRNDLGRTRIKICGLTRKTDAYCAAMLGVDAIGLVFYPPSPRAVSVALAREIVSGLPPFVSVVALFVDETRGRIHEIIENVAVDLLQFHGDESPEFCASFPVPYIKAIRMDGRVDIGEMERRYSGARGLLLDAFHPEQKGGTGVPFDWTQISGHGRMPIILAGGLQAGNVCNALELVHPYGLDASSGVEAGKGIKDRDKMAAFLAEVRRFDCRTYDYGKSSI